jgi:hypothetical protein|tara:strand:+ start:507 stop:674 length:168 start_codon:yes stop_codon:yes gene_type:complete
MTDIIDKILNMSMYENGYKEINQKCDHKFDIDSCNEEGLAVCSECGTSFDEIRQS